MTRLYLTPLLLLAAACAGKLNRGGPRPTVSVDMAACRTIVEHDSSVKRTSGMGALPDARMCEALRAALVTALGHAGYESGAAGKPGKLHAKVHVTQRARVERSGPEYDPRHAGFVKVEVLVSIAADGAETEKIVADVRLDAVDQLDQQLADAADRLVADIAASPSLNQVGPPSS